MSRKVALHPAISTLVTPDLDATEALVMQAQSGDETARKRIVHAWYPWVTKRARNFAARHGRLDLVDDLAQAGVCGTEPGYVSGLYAAIAKFKPTEGAKFSTYATYWINEAFDKVWQRETPQGKGANTKKLDARIRRLAAEVERYLGRPPTVDEIRRAMGLGDKRYPLARRVARAFEDADIDELDDADGATQPETIERAVLASEVWALVERLAPSLRDVLVMRYAEGLTSHEVAARLYCTRQNVNALERKALAELQGMT